MAAREGVTRAELVRAAVHEMTAAHDSADRKKKSPLRGRVGSAREQRP
jgi:hypothetical protein